MMVIYFRAKYHLSNMQEGCEVLLSAQEEMTLSIIRCVGQV